MDHEAGALRHLSRVGLLGVVIVGLLAGSLAAPGSAHAAPSGRWVRVNPGDFQAFQWEEDGVLFDRFISEKTFNETARRMAAGWTYTNRGSGYSAGEISTGSSVATKLRTAATTAGTVATLRQLKSEGLSLMGRMKAFGTLRLLGDLALAATAFEIGYSVGGQLADLIFGGHGSETVSEGTHKFEAVAISPRGAGESVCTDYNNVQSGPCASGGAGLAYPYQVAVVMWHQVGGSGQEARYFPDFFGDSEGKCSQWSYYNAPAGASFLETGRQNNSCGGKTWPIRAGVETVPLEVSHLPGEEGGKPEKTITKEMPKAMTAEEAEKIAKECLLGFLGCRYMPGWWWNHDPEMKEKTEKGGTGAIGLDPSDPVSVRVPAFGEHENYKEYDEKLEKLELVPENLVLSETAIDTSKGPEEVTSTSPAAKTQLEPGKKVRVRYNPATAPDPGTSSPWSPPSIPAIDVSPLGGLEPCGVFPFGLLCWFGEGLAQFDTAGVCPEADVTVPPIGDKAEPSDFNLSICGETTNTVMDYVRPAELLFFIIGLGFLFAKATGALGGSD